MSYMLHKDESKTGVKWNRRRNWYAPIVSVWRNCAR